MINFNLTNLEILLPICYSRMPIFMFWKIVIRRINIAVSVYIRVVRNIDIPSSSKSRSVRWIAIDSMCCNRNWVFLFKIHRKEESRGIILPTTWLIPISSSETPENLVVGCSYDRDSGTFVITLWVERGSSKAMLGPSVNSGGLSLSTILIQELHNKLAMRLCC